MNKKGLSRRDFIKLSGAASASAMLSNSFGVPAFVRQVGDPDYSDPAQVATALTAEGATVQMSSWGFGGLSTSVLPEQFAAYTQAMYGVPVTLIWTGSSV